MVGTEGYSEAAVAASRNLAVWDRWAARNADSVVRPERTAQLFISGTASNQEKLA